MIPIVVFWTQYTAKVEGSVLKDVRCENCSTEYVYVMKREGTGAGTGVYRLNDPGAAENAASGARESLNAALKHDFDPVPCPACGHYQRHMYPKLVEGKWLGLQALMLLAILACCLATAIALYWSGAYLLTPNDYDFGNMVRAWPVVLILGIVALSLSLLRRNKVRCFDPNLEDHEARLALGRSRAVTRAEFEQARQKRETGTKGDKGS